MDKFYIFPINFKQKEKILGIIDYKTATILAIIGFICFYILKNMQIEIEIKIRVFIFVWGIPALFLIGEYSGESMLELFGSIIKYFIRPGAYVFRKGETSEKFKICKVLVSDVVYKKRHY